MSAWNNKNAGFVKENWNCVQNTKGWLYKLEVDWALNGHTLDNVRLNWKLN